MNNNSRKSFNPDWYEAVLDALPVCLYVADARGNGVYANRSAREVIGEDISEMDVTTLVNRHPAADDAGPRTDAQRPIIRAMAGEHSREEMTVTIRGDEHIADVCGAPIFDREGRLSYALTSFINITDKAREHEELARRNRALEARVRERTRALEEARDRAENANAAKGQFLAGMSHEIRSPLNSILGFIRLLQRDQGLTAEQAEFVGHIATSAEHLLTVVNDVLDLSKIEAGEAELHESAFSPRRMLRSIVRMHEGAAADKGLDLQVELAGNVPDYIRGDEGKVRQILINLVSNALKFTDTGRVRVEAQTAAGDLELAVIDTGVGLHPPQLVEIFEHFRQTRRGKKAGGTGLGLPISRALARFLGGDLTAESVRGKGSRFTLRFPLREAQAPDKSGEELIHELELPRELDILIVDDQESDRFALGKLLSLNGWSVRACASGQECLEAIHRRRPDVVLMDLSMPDLGGAEAIRMIRSEWGNAISVLVVTAAAFGNEEELSYEAGADGFLRKPAGEIELVRAIADISTGAAGSRRRGAEPANPAAIAAVRSRDRERIGDAAGRADLDALTEVIEEVAEYSPDAAGVLHDLTHRLAYDEIIALIGPIGITASTPSQPTQAIETGRRT